MKGLVAAPPQAKEDVVVVGDLRVPFYTVRLLNDQGSFVDVELLELSRNGGHYLFQWLFKPLGVSLADFRTGAPWRLPFFQELRKAITPDNLKRDRSGILLSPEKHVRPMLLGIQVRGRKMMARTSRNHLQVDLVDKDGIDWLLAAIWADLDNATGFPEVGLDAPRAERPLPKAFVDALEPGINELRATKLLQCVSVDKHHGRIRMVVSNKPLAVVYLPIPRWRRMVSELDEITEHDAVHDLANWVARHMVEEAIDKLEAAKNKR